MSAAEQVVRIPAEVVESVDNLVGAEQRDEFIRKTVERAIKAEIDRRCMLKMLREESPIWKEEITRSSPGALRSMSILCGKKKMTAPPSGRR